MPKRNLSSNNKIGNVVEAYEHDDHVEAVFVPDPNTSDHSDICNSDESDSNSVSGDEDTIDDNVPFPILPYNKVLQGYDDVQKKLENQHVYNWVDGEKVYNETLCNDILLTEKDKQTILSSSYTDIFEFFFNSNLKKLIVDCTTINGYELSLNKFDTFLGIIIFTIFNKRFSQRDFWSTDPLLRAEPVASAMSRNEFEKIKSSLKYSTPEDMNLDDKAWRIRKMLNIFNENTMRFGVFSTAISIDEMMVRFFGKIQFKQFIKSKPIRFGIKLWALCSANGFVFHCDIYCGKIAKNSEALSSCTQGSRVVMQMLQNTLTTITYRKLQQYHVYFDNLFCSPDLLVHLKKIGLRPTGTLRKDRLKESNNIDKNAPRGSFGVKHDTNSGINFITVIDSKPVSILSTAAGVTPLLPVNRYNKEKREKTDLPFPHAFTNYNRFMGGVDLHDQHCNKAMPTIRSKKWTWVMFLRIIQSSITNANVLYNSANPAKKTGIKDFALSISRSYLQKAKESTMKNHVIQTTKHQKKCHTCKVRTFKFCESCETFVCAKCSKQFHE